MSRSKSYVAELRRLSEHCGFGTAEQLDAMLRDRLVVGVQDARVQKRLLAEPDLKFKKAFELAQAMETAEQNAREIQGSGPCRSTKGEKHVWKVKESPKPTEETTCYRCGGKHEQMTCRFKEVLCRSCGKKGHIAKVCRSKPNPEHKRKGMKPKGTDRAHQIRCSSPGEEVGEYSLYSITGTGKRAYTVKPKLNGVELEMEIDTGATLSLISEETYCKLWQAHQTPTLETTDTNLRTYTGEKITALGKIKVEVAINSQLAELSLLVVKGNGPSLLGVDWLEKLRLDWKLINQVQNQTELQRLLEKHQAVFEGCLGCIKGVKAKFYLKPHTQPKFCRARTVPFALRGKVEAKLQRLQDAGVIEQVQHFEWATPIVPVVKQNGEIRICGDYKVTLNNTIRVDSYPLPRVDDLLGSLAGGQKFSKLDLAHAYMQVQLDESSKPLTTINTHKGLYQYHRLPFGVASAPAIFQRTMETLLQGLPQVFVYIDDILVTGKTEDEHLKNLHETLQRLEDAGICLKKDKCAFLLPEVEYLGHVLSADGIRPSRKNVKAIEAAPAPETVTQLKSFLGMVTYYLKFLPNLSSTLAPLYSLLQDGTPWKWGPKQAEAFTAVKKQLTSPIVLSNFDPEKDLVLLVDASPYGLGAVLAHRQSDGTDKPIAYTSRSLAPAEKRYSQLDKEALAIVFGVKKFHNYVYGRMFTLVSDHKPLQHILGETKPVPHKWHQLVYNAGHYY